MADLENPSSTVNELDWTGVNSRKPGPLERLITRYLVPNPIVALYYSIRYNCMISLQARVQLSNQISFGRGTVIKPFAILQTWGGKITIGRQCAVGSFNHLSTGFADIILGDYVRMGPSVTIIAGSHNFQKKNQLIINQDSYHKPVTIGSDVLIGANVVILPGAEIADGAVVGAGSVVSKAVPAYTIVAGSPAQIIGKRE
jgi:acetyltransferase-like isoleucine patch superfamily enzyme